MAPHAGAWYIELDGKDISQEISDIQITGTINDLTTVTVTYIDNDIEIEGEA